MSLSTMKILLGRIAALVGLSLLTLSSARALDFNWDGSTGMVGTIRSGEPANPEYEADYANWLLGLASNVETTHDFGSPEGSHTFKTSSVDYDSAVALSNGQQSGGLSGSGWDWVLAKYDGPNGGDVLWYVGGAAFTLPSDSEGLWENTAGEGYGLSHWTGFGGSTSVPDGGMTAILLGLGLAAIAAVASRRQIS